jgi:hypothetical protein
MEEELKNAKGVDNQIKVDGDIIYGELIDAINNYRSQCPIHQNQICIQTLALGNHNLILKVDEIGIEKLSDHSRSGRSVLIPKKDIDAYLNEINTGKIVPIDPYLSPARNNSVLIGAIIARALPGRIRIIDNNKILKM